LIDLLRRYEVDVRIHASRGEDLALAGDRFGARTDDDADVRLGIGIPGFADAGDATIAEANVGFIYAGVIDDEGIGDHGIDRTFGPRRLGLTHAVADDLAATELHLF